jgi:hypothetical protein
VKKYFERLFLFINLENKIQNRKYPEPTLTRYDLPKHFVFSIAGTTDKEVFDPLFQAVKLDPRLNTIDHLGIPTALLWCDPRVKYKQMDVLREYLPLAAQDLINEGKIRKKVKSKIEQPELNHFKFMNGSRYFLRFERNNPDQRMKFPHVPRKKKH